MNNKELRLHIRALGEKRRLPNNTQAGLCEEIQCLADIVQYGTVKLIMEVWPKGSGDSTFPVPHPRVGPRIAYFHIYNIWQVKKNKNKADRKYVKNRLKMCRWVAKQLKMLGDWQ